MSKKFIILITVLILILVLFFGFSYLTKKENPAPQAGEIKEENFFANIFNFSNIKNNETINEVVDFITGNDNNENEDSKIKNKLNKISSVAVSGYGVYDKEIYKEIPDVEPNEIKQATLTEQPTSPETEFISVIKYSDKNNGNIYQTLIEDLEEKVYSSTIIPNVHETLFTKNNVIYRYLKNGNTIVTFLGELPKEILGQDSNNNEIFGSFLPDGIKDISISPSKENIFYLNLTKNGVVGILINNTGTKNNIFESSFSEWYSSWVNDDLIILNTKPSGVVDGFAYLLNTKNKSFDKVLDKVKGLTTLANKDLSYILYSDNNLSLKLFNPNNGGIRNLRINTHTEKCTWSNDNITLYCAIPKTIEGGYIYPDAWYQGEVSYNDEIWKINTETGAKTKLIDPQSLYENEVIDATNLSLDKNEKTLLFMNKVDSYLWGLSLD